MVGWRTAFIHQTIKGEHFHFRVSSLCLKKSSQLSVRLWQCVDSSFLSSMLPWDQRGLGPTRVCWRSSRSVWCWRWLKGGGCTCRGRHRRDISDADCFTFALSYLGYRFADRSEMECDFRERRKLYVCTLCDKLISFFRKRATYIIFEIGTLCTVC